MREGLVDNGSIRREGNTVVVEITGKTKLAGRPGVTCLNPDSPEHERVYRKTFCNKQVYLPHEYALAVGNHLHQADSFVVSMNGFSELTVAQCAELGIKHGAYEAVCEALLTRIYLDQRAELPGARVRFAEGATRMGVDGATIRVAEHFNIMSLGFSCPEFMFYVDDDSRPVYVSENKLSYAEDFVRSVDLLIITGGREQSFYQDIVAATRYRKKFYVVDVVGILSGRGSSVAHSVQPDGHIVIQNAAAAFLENFHAFKIEEGKYGRNGDAWEDLFAETCALARAVSRKKLSVELMFPKPKPHEQT